MLKSFSALLAASLSLLLALSVESRPALTDKPGQTAAVYSESSFCLLLPKDRGGNVCKNEPAILSLLALLIDRRATHSCFHPTFILFAFLKKIAKSEDSAIAFCTTEALETSLKAKALPEGFIKSAHISRNDGEQWIQVTGKIDRSKYGLDPHDGGGQYDVKAPQGSSCEGYKAFVQITEPDNERYCLRCCKDPSYCPRGKSTKGCETVLGGTYS